MDSKENMDDCEKCADAMKGSVKPYDRHVIVCFPLNRNDNNPSWLGSVEDIPAIGSLVEEITKLTTSTFNVRLTVCDYDKCIENEKLVEQVDYFNYTVLCTIPSITVLIYPESIIATLSTIGYLENDPNEVSTFCRWVTNPKSSITSLHAALRELQGANSRLSTGLSNGVNIMPIPWKKLILVCIHALRDKRCGRAGPLIMNEINVEMTLFDVEEKELKVLGSSHIGGHKYAGVLIVYPEADWYGRISKATVGALLNRVLSSTSSSVSSTRCEEVDAGDRVFMEKCFRGNGYNCVNKVDW